MSFSVRDEGSGLEYNGTTLNSLFAQRRILLRPSFWRMILDILRFHRRAPRLLEGPESETEPALGDVLRTGRYSRPFVENYLLPMAPAIWSSDPGRILSFPARTFVRFFHNHGMLSVSERPTCRVVKVGSRVYVEALTRPCLDRIRLSTPVERIRRHSSHVEVTPRGGETERFDEVVLAADDVQLPRTMTSSISTPPMQIKKSIRSFRLYND